MLKVSQVLNRKSNEEYRGIVKKTTFKGHKKEIKTYSKPISYNYESKNQYNKFDIETELQKDKLYQKMNITEPDDAKKKELAKLRRYKKIGRFYMEMDELKKQLFYNGQREELYKLLPDNFWNWENFEDIDDLYLDENKYIAKKFNEFNESKELAQCFLAEREQFLTPNVEIADLYQKNELRAIYSILGEIKMQTDMRAVKNIKNLIDCNVGQFQEIDKWVTLTYSDENYDHSCDREQVKKDLRAFIQRLNRRFKTKVEYLCVLEIQHGRLEKYGTKNWHLHIALFNCPYLPFKENSSKIEQLKKEEETYKIKLQIKKLQRENNKFWKFGNFDIRALKNSNLGDYLTKYVSKDFAFREFDPKFNTGHRYFRSNGLYKPLEVLNSQEEDFKIFDERYYLEKLRVFENYDKTTEIRQEERVLDDNKILKSRRKITDKLINQFTDFLDVSLESEELTNQETKAVVQTLEEIDQLKEKIEYYNEKFDIRIVKNYITDQVKNACLEKKQEERLLGVLSTGSLKTLENINQIIIRVYKLFNPEIEIEKNNNDIENIEIFILSEKAKEILDKILIYLINIKGEYMYYTKFRYKAHYEQQNILIQALKFNYRKIVLADQMKIEEQICRAREQLLREFQINLIEERENDRLKKQFQKSLKQKGILYVKNVI